MLDAGAPHVIKADAVFVGELAALLDDLRGLNILRRRKVIHHKDHFLRIKNARAFDLLEFFDGQHAR